MTNPKPKGDKTHNRRSIARINAVQALYQLRMSSDSAPQKVVHEFKSHRLTAVNDPEHLGAADEKHFSMLVEGVNERAVEIDDLIRGVLNKDWRLERLENILLSILRAGVYELLSFPNITPAIIINEYVEITKAFYAGSETGMVNGILDNLSKKCR